MNILPIISKSLNKEEIRNLKLFLNRTNSNKNRKDELLFDLVKSSNLDKYDEDKIYSKIYGISGNKNSFYRLKNRLLEDISISLSQFHYNETELHLILNNFLLSKVFSLKNEWQIALHYIVKAEKKAEENNIFQLLDLIYSEIISLSHEILEINPDEYIQKRNLNRIKISEIQELDDLLATIVYKIRKSQNFSGSNSQLNDLLSKYFNNPIVEKKISTNVQYKFKIYETISRVLLSLKDYISLENYLLNTYNDFTKHQLFKKHTHHTKLQMLTYIVNALFMNDKYAKSLQYLDVLKNSLFEFDKMHYDKYIFYYYNGLVNNYSKTDPIKALEPLNEAKENKAIIKHPFFVGYIYLNLGVTYYNLKDYKTALKSIVKLCSSQNFQLLDESFRFSILIAETQIRFFIGDGEYNLTRINQIKKEYKNILKDKEFERDKNFIQILSLQLKTDTKLNLHKKQMLLKDFMKNNKKENSKEILDYTEFLTSIHLINS